MLTFWGISMVQAQNEYSTIVVETRSGTTLELSLRQKPEVIVSEKEFIISCGDNVTSYLHEEVRKFYFKPYTPTEIERTTNEQVIRIEYLDDSKIVISGITEAEKVCLYTLNGQNIDFQPINNGDRLTIPLSSLPSGTYILNIDNRQSFKILKR